MSVSVITAVSCPIAKAKRQSGQSAVPLPVTEHRRPIVGTLLDNRFRLSELIYSSANGISDVFRAEDLFRKTPVVVKFGPEKDPNRLIGNETGVIVKLGGIFFPNYISHGDNYLVIEHLNGVSLAEIIKNRKDIPLHKLIDLALSIIYGLGILHEHAFVHCDIKPQNIFVNKDQIFIFDFGLTRPNGYWSREDQEDGKIVGTPIYMSPEQIDLAPLHPKMDFYSAGIMLYEMFTGVNPKNGKNFQEVIKNHKEINMPELALGPIAERYMPDEGTGVISRIREIVRNRSIKKLHATLANLIEGMTRKEKESRLGNIDAIVQQLEKANKLAAKLARYEIA